jgi:hypothetical protein
MKQEIIATGSAKVGSGTEYHPAVRVRWENEFGVKGVRTDLTCKCGCKGRQTRIVFYREDEATVTCKGV